jgi:hypothetical protein
MSYKYVDIYAVFVYENSVHHDATDTYVADLRIRVPAVNALHISPAGNREVVVRHARREVDGNFSLSLDRAGLHRICMAGVGGKCRRGCGGAHCARYQYRQSCYVAYALHSSRPRVSRCREGRSAREKTVGSPVYCTSIRCPALYDLCNEARATLHGEWGLTCGKCRRVREILMNSPKSAVVTSGCPPIGNFARHQEIRSGRGAAQLGTGLPVREPGSAPARPPGCRRARYQESWHPRIIYRGRMTFSHYRNRVSRQVLGSG